MESSLNTKNTNSKFYIVDHQEGSLLDWCLSEYQQMMKYLKQSPSKLIITNSTTLKDTSDCDESLAEKSKNCLNELNSTIESENKKEQFILFDESVNSLVKLEDNQQYLYLPSENRKVPLNRVCLLDLRAEKELAPSDSEEFDVLIFGGILGDNPPQDRTKYLRDSGFLKRHLGPIQMSTDTAVLTSKLILENKILINDIPFIVEPEFFKNKTENKENDDKFEDCVCMEGFRFVSDEIDPHSGLITKSETPKPLGHKKIYEDLIFEEFDPSMFI